jgi:hypothetical protein
MDEWIDGWMDECVVRCIDGRIIIIFNKCNWVDTRWQWSFNILHVHGL